MQFTEAELTNVLKGVALATLAAQSKDIRKGRLDVEQVWQDLGGYGRYEMLEGLSHRVLPALVALPEVDRVHGKRLKVRGSQLRAAVEETTGEEAGTGVRRKAYVVSMAALIAAGLAGLPPYVDPEK
ncbi:hypothetical protein [Nocardioides marmorisolisilvae]|uniref:Uncharacterized protein n=1 Tax=Nocardioides marmorisolisilvae TaxID=1542737 RepID=A0A3N0E0P3_9ACTN|nr:hypothetical protein [Nocardioides marmorisolisilvae]RNL81380.1 hypothetical protein EFL95_03275 [Nocardioides marmorisolisilvae]